MELKVKTSVLQEMVGKAIKCVSNNKLIPITSLMNVKVKDNHLQLTTTDATNYFYVGYPEKVDCEDFEVSVIADTFTKLIQKTTTEEITLTFSNDEFKVKGNGTYNMDLPLDENGKIIHFPIKVLDDFREEAGEIKLSTIKTILTFNKPSLATSVEHPALTCYYCGDSVVTSDRFKICRTDIRLFDVPMLFTAQLMELLGTFSSENISVSLSQDKKDLIFISGNDMVYAPIVEGVDTYPITPILQLVDSDFESQCKISRVAVLDLLDRLSLFVSKYDKKAIRLTFTKDGIMFSSKKSNGVELIPYIGSDYYKDYTCMVDIEMFRSQIASQVADNINLYYGFDIALKIVSDNITQIVALAEED